MSLCQVADTEVNPTRRVKTADVWGPFTLAALVNVNNTDNKIQLLPYLSTILTSISHPPFSIPSQLAHYLPSALFCSDSILFSSSLSSQLGFCTLCPNPFPEAPPVLSEVKGPSFWISQVERFLCFPLLLASLISKDQKRIYWDHLSTSKKGLGSAYWSGCCARWAQIIEPGP